MELENPDLWENFNHSFGTQQLNDTQSSEDVPALTMDDLSPDGQAVREVDHRSRVTFSTNGIQTASSIRNSDKALGKDLYKQNKVPSQATKNKQKFDFNHTSFYTSDDQYSGMAAGTSMCGDKAENMVLENESLRKKLLMLRDENSHLVSQNHKLLNELEGTSCDLHQSRLKCKELSEQRIAKDAEIVELEEELRRLKLEADRLEKALRVEEDRNEHNQLITSSFESKLKEKEAECLRWQRHFDQLNDAKRGVEESKKQAQIFVEELQKELVDTKARLQLCTSKFDANEEELRKKYEESEKSCRELVSVVATLRNQLVQGQEETKSSLQTSQLQLTASERKNAELTMKVEQQMLAIEKLENQLMHLSNVEADKKIMEETIESQREQLTNYSSELHRTRSRLEQLERLAQQLDIKMQSLSDSGMSSLRIVELAADDASSLDGSYLSTMKSSSKGFDKLRHYHGREVESTHHHASRSTVGPMTFSGCVERIRSDLLAFFDRSQLGERSRREVEELFSFLENEHITNVQKVETLEAELANLIDNLQQKNERIAAAHKELEEKTSKLTKIEREVKKRQVQIVALEKQLDEKVGDVADMVSRMADVESAKEKLLAEYHQVCNNLEEKQKEFKEMKTSVERQQISLNDKSKEYHSQLQQLEKILKEKSDELSQKDALILKLEQDINAKEAAFGDLKQEITSRDDYGQKLVRQLEQQIGSEAEQVRELEHSLAVCKEEVKLYVEHLQVTKTNFDVEISQKQQQMEKLQNHLITVEKLKRELEIQVGDLQQSLSERLVMLKQSSSRISELEESQLMANKQIAQLEQQLHQQKAQHTDQIAKIQSEYRSLEQKFLHASEELEHFRKQQDETATVLRDIKIDRKKLAEELTEMQRQLSAERQDTDDKAAQLTRIEAALREQKHLTREKEEHVVELEDRLSVLQNDLREKTQAVNELTALFQKAQTEVSNVSSKLNLAEESQEKLRRDLSLKEQLIAELRQTLRQKQDELSSKSRELEEMELLCHERQVDVQERALQVSQLDITIAEYKADMEARLIKLEAALKKSQADVQLRTKQVSDLDDRVHSLLCELKDKSQQLITLQQNNLSQKMSLDQRNELVDQLKKELESMKVKCNSLEQQISKHEHDLTLSREECKRLEAFVMESKGNMSLAKSDFEKIKTELSGCRVLLQEKDAEMRKMKSWYEDDIRSKEETAAVYTQHMKKLMEAEQKLLAELKLLKSQFNELECEVQAQKSCENLNHETLYLKDSEIARLQAKLSGYQRLLALGPSTVVEQQSFTQLSKSQNLEPKLDDNCNMIEASGNAKYSPEVALVQLSNILSRSLVSNSSHPVSSSLVNPSCNQAMHQIGAIAEDGGNLKFGDISSISSNSTYNVEDDPNLVQVGYNKGKMMHEGGPENVSNPRHVGMSSGHIGTLSHTLALTSMSTKDGIGDKHPIAKVSNFNSAPSKMSVGIAKKSTVMPRPATTGSAKSSATASGFQTGIQSGKGDISARTNVKNSPRKTPRDRTNLGRGLNNNKNNNNNSEIYCNSRGGVYSAMSQDGVAERLSFDEISAVTHYSSNRLNNSSNPIIGTARELNHGSACDGPAPVKIVLNGTTASFIEQLNFQRQSLENKQQHLLSQMFSSDVIPDYANSDDDSDI